MFGHLADTTARHGAGLLRVTAVAAEGRLRIQVADDGAGIAARDRERVSQPPFTTCHTAGVIGVGLGIVWCLLQAHGGSTEVVPTTGGALFGIVLSATKR